MKTDIAAALTDGKFRNAYDWLSLGYEAGRSSSMGELWEAVEAVCWFDWSDNDPDACAAIDRLRTAVEAYQKGAGTPRPLPCPS